MNKLRQMSVFAYIVECGSITATAETLGLSKSVISQHLKTLEQDLGLSLLKRTTRQQSLTTAGEQFYQHCRQLNRLADTAWAQAQQGLQRVQGKIRITAPNALMDSLLAPIISRLMQAHPEFEPELISNDQALNLNVGNIDLAIRVGSSADSNLKQQALGQFRDVLCVGKDLDASKAKTLPYIANAWEGKQIDYLLQQPDTSNSMRYQAKAQCQTDSLNTNLALIKAGAGIACLPEFVWQQHSHDLKPIFTPYQLPLNTIYALHPYSDFVPANVTVCIKAIKAELKYT